MSSVKYVCMSVYQTANDAVNVTQTMFSVPHLR